MRIGVDARCLEWERGGVARYLLNILREWATYKDDNTYVLYFQNQVPEDSFLYNDKFDLKVIRGPKFLKSSRILTEQLLMPWELKKDKLDIFFATWYTTPLLKWGTKVLLAVWDISYTTHPEHYSISQRISLGFFSRKSAAAAAGILACSEYDAKQIQQHYKVPEKKIYQIRFATDNQFTEVRNQKRLEEVVKKYSLPKKYLLCLGFIYNRRNVPIVIEAFKLLSNKYPDYCLVVCGKNLTSPRIDIQMLLDPLIDKDKAKYINWFDDEDLVQIYQNSFAFICTSTVDAENIMMQEAAKCGTCIVSSPLLMDCIGSNAYLIEDPECVSATFATLDKLMGGDEMREKFIAGGLEWSKSKTWPKVAKTTLEILETVGCGRA